MTTDRPPPDDAAPPSDTPSPDAPPRPTIGPLTCLAIAILAGTALGGALSFGLLYWITGAFLLLAACLIAHRARWPAARLLGLLAVTFLIAGWTDGRLHSMSDHDIRRFIGPERQLARVRGVVDSAPRSEAGPQGALARFSFQPVSTNLTIDLDQIEIDGRLRPATGRLLVTLQQADHRLTVGDRIEAAGWLDTIAQSANPGQFDFRAWAASQNLHGRLTLPTRDNWQPLSPGSPREDLLRWRHQIAQYASASLRSGFENRPRIAALLDALVLGRINPELTDTREVFRQVGLSHLLAISGAHLGMLLGLAWLLGRGVFHHPARANLFVLAVLIAYLLIVPWRAPIVRAGLMAGVFCLGRLGGRRTPALELLALACILRLIYQPVEIFNPGFQLSFGIVAGLILLVPRVSERLSPRPLDPPAHWSATQWTLRIAADYLAVSLIAFLIALPIAAGHFHMLSPYGWLASLLATPLTGLIIGVAFIKMILGAIAPGAGLLLAYPLEWLTHVMLFIADIAHTLPGATIILRGRIGWLWPITALTVILLALAGKFPQRRDMFAALALCAAWLIWHQQGRPTPFTSRPAMQIAMIAVGDGNCFVVRTFDQTSHEEHTLLFDCGGQGPGRIAQRTIAPALRSIGIDRIDTLILSHPDMDHFSATHDLIDELPVARVLLSPQFQREAAQQPGGATAALLEGLTQRDITIETVARGWNEQHDSATFDILWPPADRLFQHDNDSSIVLSVRAANRRLLLTGDIDRDAIESLLKNERITADICDLPHHGAFTTSAQQWIESLGPRIVLQSCSTRRWDNDPWHDFFTSHPADRYITARDGMVVLVIHYDGRIESRTFTNNDGVGR